MCVFLLLDAEDEEADGVGVFRAGAVGLACVDEVEASGFAEGTARLRAARAAALLAADCFGLNPLPVAFVLEGGAHVWSLGKR